ncbi:MBL fold metallo-hydrolase [Pseudenhygromyxa sp. WMMC2535]|uniref:MBL fold metallo-hydrolase n=1 Tax=Pseudenhygromyxa sp. WMMC2535 TaxID=2712867 RepID=UPI00155688C9|nr:MBL fold metallo-hydrolase [Pseudenhygromyxa sp. WMMC2535]NVB40432.1 MBL fold metallo-hydrolase [Pseudenhygromyxa sp. WMMC2535]
MQIHQLRNASLILSVGEHRLLVDPMLSDPGAFPSFKLTGEKRKNPLVPLPPGTDAALEEVSAVVLTHEHPDHLDPPGLEWIRRRGLSVWTNAVDAPNLARKGVKVEVLGDGALGMAVEVLPGRHGHGLVGWLMGPVHGYYLAHPGEPSVYLTGDAVLTDALLEILDRLRPDVVVAPAGAANFGIGRDILFSVDELMTVIRHAPGQVVLNHLEALDHCPTTRAELRQRLSAEGLSERVHVPEDGEVLSFARAPVDAPPPQLRGDLGERPGLQKWLTAKFAGT